MTSQEMLKKKLPDVPGVYFFKCAGEIVYIGRATSLRDRLKSYFKDDVIKTRGPLIVDMVTRADELDFITTESVLDAIILEANLIKKYQPHANAREKDDKSFNYVVITDEKYPRVELMRSKDLESPLRAEGYPSTGRGSRVKSKDKLKAVFGPYPQGFILKEGLKIIRRVFPYRDRKCVPESGQPCFNRQIGVCPGTCTREISKKDYNRTILHLKLFFEGKKGELLKKLEREMKEFAKKREFEKANAMKKTTFALTHIQDLTLIKAESRETPLLSRAALDNRGGAKNSVRIEAYDIAHISGTSTSGVMVVIEDNHVKKSDYRMFRIRHGKGNNDILGLQEVLTRRLSHQEWTYPSLIVVDGGALQKKAAEEIVRLQGRAISVVAVKKNEKHRPEEILGDETLIHTYKREILLANSEAHRFAIKYHRKLRGKSFGVS